MATKFTPPGKPASKEIVARPKLVAKFAERYSVDAEKMLATLKATAFHTKQEVSNEQLMGLLIVADQYHLNPFTREIYAFVDHRTGAVVPVVGVDGWIRIVNEHPAFSSITFAYPDVSDDELLPWVECSIARKDRDQPVTLREYFVECKRNTDAWASHPRRMLRHKALVQTARIAFGFAGIYDPDEADRMREAMAADAPRKPIKPVTVAPQALPGNGPEVIPAVATGDQIAMVQDALKEANIPVSDCLQQFNIENIEALPFDQVAEALAWAKRNAE